MVMCFHWIRQTLKKDTYKNKTRVDIEPRQPVIKRADWQRTSLLLLLFKDFCEVLQENK